MCIDYNGGGGYIEDKGLDFVLVFKGSDGGTIPERDGAISKVFLFFFLKQVTVQVEKRQIRICSFEDKGTRGTYCTGGGGNGRGFLCGCTEIYGLSG